MKIEAHYDTRACIAIKRWLLKCSLKDIDYKNIIPFSTSKILLNSASIKYFYSYILSA